MKGEGGGMGRRCSLWYRGVAKGKGEGRVSQCHRGAPREHEGALGEHWGSTGGAEREHEAVQGRSRWEPEVDFLYLGLSCL